MKSPQGHCKGTFFALCAVCSVISSSLYRDFFFFKGSLYLIFGKSALLKSLSLTSLMVNFFFHFLNTIISESLMEDNG